jgi:hypothetical protein
MIFVAELDTGPSTQPEPGEWLKLFGQIAKNLKGNNLFLFGQVLVFIFGVIFIPIWLRGVLSEGYIVAILFLLALFIILSHVVVIVDIHSKKKK